MKPRDKKRMKAFLATLEYAWTEPLLVRLLALRFGIGERDARDVVNEFIRG